MPRPVPVLDLRFPADTTLADRISAALHDLAPAAVHEAGPDAAPHWRVFFSSPEARDEASRRLTREFAPEGLTAAAAEEPDEDWAARSQAGLAHVRVGRVIVAPPWDVPSLLFPDDVVVLIKPSMGFGTAHHESTRLCLDLLQRLDCAGRRVVDAGTGSGVLAIAAVALGAREVVAFDIDPDAVACAEENAALNFPGIDRSAIPLRISVAALDVPQVRGAGPQASSSADPPYVPADIVLANLTGAALSRHAAALLAHAAPDARLILSGFLDHETDAVLRAFAEGSSPEAIIGEGEWRAVQLRARPTRRAAREG